MFALEIGYFFRIWAKTCQTFSKFIDDTHIFSAKFKCLTCFSPNLRADTNYIK